MNLSPAPGIAPWPSMLLAQTRIEVVLTLRRGESVLLTLGIPLVLLGFFTGVHVLPADGRTIDFLTPGILALAVTSAGFTGLAIATGFERSYGVLRRLGTTPLPRWVLLAAKTLGVVLVEVVQALLIGGLALALGWHPRGNPAGVLLLVVLGTAASCGLGLLRAGTLPALVTLAAANAVWLALLLLGAVVFPASQLGALRGLSPALPTGALAHGLRAVLQHGTAVPGRDVLVLLAWAVVALGLAARTFRWSA
jgi:ABC-2 type transport system permease protein